MTPRKEGPAGLYDRIGDDDGGDVFARETEMMVPSDPMALVAITVATDPATLRAVAQAARAPQAKKKGKGR